MKLTQIYENLCYYDKRNPYYWGDDDDFKPSKPCSCDNCFYKRNELALEIIKLQK